MLWLWQQMSREKDVEEGDRRGLVEEGTICPLEDAEKSTKPKVLTEVKWVAEPVSETKKTATTAVVCTALTEAPEVVCTKVMNYYY